MSDAPDQPASDGSAKPKGRNKKRLFALAVLCLVGLALSLTLMGGSDDRASSGSGTTATKTEARSEGGISVTDWIPPGSTAIGSDSAIPKPYQACILCHGSIYHGR